MSELMPCCAAYQQQAPLWTYLDDVFMGAEVWLGRDTTGINPTDKALIYLPREAAETGADYRSRLARSPWVDLYAQAIRKFTGLIFANPIESDTSSNSITPHLANIDQRGNAFQAFLRAQAALTMRLGHSFVLVDYPPLDPAIKTHADYLAAGRRPHWVSYSPLALVNWRSQLINGREVLTLAVLREVLTVPDGEYGERQVERFRVLRPGRWQLLEVQLGTDKKPHLQLIDEGEFSLSYIPLIPIYADDALSQGWGLSRPPLKALADLNVVHYQVKSDHLRKVHLCCMPIPELRDSLRSEGEPLTLGPTTFIHIRDPQGAFNWREPAATSIVESRREVNDIEGAADILSAAYLSKPADRQSALATLAQSAEIESSLQTFTAAFFAGVNRCLAVHADYLNAQAPTVYIKPEVLREQGSDSQLLMAYTSLATTLATLPPAIARFLLDLLVAAEFVPRNVNLPDIAVSAS